MKNIILTLATAACVAAFAEDAKAPAKVAAKAPVKADAKYVDPNPFADYGVAMQSTEKDPLAVNWSKQHDAEIKAATTDAALAAVVADAAHAEALLAKVKPAYESDPLVLTQIAAVTQWVLLPDPWYSVLWGGAHGAGRAVWVAALERKIAESKDDYIRTFCRQQLDLCAIQIRK